MYADAYGVTSYYPHAAGIIACSDGYTDSIHKSSAIDM